MGVGSVATRLLADFGADVIKIEDRIRIDTPRRLPIYKDAPARNFGEEVVGGDPNRGGLFNNYCRNKLGITLNMRTEKGRQLAERLIAKCSVVSENFAPGVMERWGLTYERLQELSPNVIYARMSGYGHSGPHAGYRSYGPVVQAVSGLSYISGLPGKEPSGWGLSYMDNQAAYYNSTALLLAIYRRNQTGQGTEVDVSAIEAGVNQLTAWTRDRDAQQITELLQSKGVPAGAVQNAEDINERDPQIAHRKVFFEMDHPVIGPARFEGTPVQFSAMGQDNWRSGPLLGEDNHHVFKDIVGVGDEEYDQLQAEGVI
jgi:crotonobetainyl-CoA:carnitine CoA-transferase CaiB-like acyl-CoA transferase